MQPPPSKSRTALARLLLPIALLIQSGCAPVRFGDVERRDFQLQDLARSYLVHAPANVSMPDGKRPLVLVIHGGGGTARNMLWLTQGRFNELADKYGFYVVYPEAIDRLWDFGEGHTSETIEQQRDDLAYFSQVIAQMERSFPIDPSRIFATGISRGGQAAYFLACKLPGRIRAIAPVAMSLPAFLEDDCTQGPPVPLALLNGTADPLVPYGGGTITVFGLKRDRVLSTDETLTLWRARNGCPDQADETETLDRVDDECRIDHLSWRSCSGAPMELFRIVNGGHTWPSGIQYLPKGLVGNVSREIDGADEAWRFFSRF
jgi:polyhydroxybutyrate depolymerase